MLGKLPDGAQAILCIVKVLIVYGPSHGTTTHLCLCLGLIASSRWLKEKLNNHLLTLD